MSLCSPAASLALKCGIAVLCANGGAAQISAGSAGRQAGASGPTPAAWIENHGQWPGDAKAVATIGSMSARLEPASIALQLNSTPDSGVFVRLRFADANPDARLELTGERPERYSYYFGNDPSGWQCGVRAWNEATYRDVWPGVDIAVRVATGSVKYDVIAQPGVDLDRVVFEVEGHSGIDIAAGGELVIRTAAGSVAQPVPDSYAPTAAGVRTPIGVQYRRVDEHHFGFSAPTRDATRALVIDPGLIWSSYIGSSSDDRAHAIALAANGETVIAGVAYWPDFPVTPGTFSSPFRQIGKAFVSVFDPLGGALVYSAVLGSNKFNTEARALAVGIDAKGEVVVGGWTTADDFPTTPGSFDPQLTGPAGATGWVTKFERGGAKLVYSTFLEGSWFGDEVHAIAVAANGAAVIGGKTSSSDFPTTPGAFDTSFGTSNPGFLCRLNATGTALEWSTFLGTSADVTAIRLDPSQGVLVAGTTSGFPVTPGAFDTSYNGGDTGKDGFVAKLTGDGKSLLWGTYLGGQGDEFDLSIAVDGAGGAAVTGRTLSQDFPITAGVFQPQHSPVGFNNFDGFVTRINSTGSALIYSTFLGGIAPDGSRGVAIDAAGIVTTAGSTGHTSFPVTAGAYDVTPFDDEGFVTRISPDGKKLFYSTFVGGIGEDMFYAMAMDAHGVVTATGSTDGAYPVTPGAFATHYSGGQSDAMLTRIELLPHGVRAFGTSTPACHGPIVIGVTEQPIAGSPTFALYASGAPQGALGWLGVSPVANSTGLPLLGFTLWLGAVPGAAVLPAPAQSIPYTEVAVPIPTGTSGLTAHAQFAFLNTAACSGAGTFSASNALTIVVQW